MDPGKRSRLWYYEDVLQVLTNGTGSEKIQGIMLSLPEKQEVQLKAQDLKKMRNLRMLIIRNAEIFGGDLHLPNNLRLLDWEEYHSPSLPSDFLPEKIVMLELRRSHITLDKPFKNYANMTSLNLSSCELLIKVPDVSGIPNLEQIILEDCKGLVEIHESLGSLDKLVYLGVERCTELKKLPSVLNLPSLSCIALNGCSQLENFPDLVGKMENLRIIEAEETAIQEFPSSVVNFSNLEMLVLKCCSNLKGLPTTISLLPNLQLLDISGCPKLQLFPKKFSGFSSQNCSTMRQESNDFSSKPCLDFDSQGIQSSHGFNLLEILDLSDCNLSDEDLHIFSCFSNLTSLDISRNHFVTLPQCFTSLSSLQELYMANCKNFQQISGIPPNLEHIDATSCTLLNSQALNLLLNQGFHKSFKFEVIAPKPKISMPFKFNYHNKGGSMSFWIGQKFPRIALCFIFELRNNRIGFFACEVQISLNGQKASNREQYFLSVSGDLVWLYHQENLIDLNTYLLHEQNYVEVTCEIVDASEDADVMVHNCGVHEYTENEEMMKPNLILCTSSSPSNNKVGCNNDYLDNTQFFRELENQSHYEDNLGIDCFSLSENLRLLEISNKQMQQVSSSISSYMLEFNTKSNELMVQKNGKSNDILSTDTIHECKEKSSLDLHLFGDRIWDPMLLECQLNCINESQLLPNGCNTSENNDVGPTLARALAHPNKFETKAYENVVLKEDSELETKKLSLQEHEDKSNEISVILMEQTKCQFDLTISDDHMKAFYATLHAETYAPLEEISDDSKLAYPKMSEETQKALKILKELLSKQISHLLEPTSSTSMKTTLEFFLVYLKMMMMFQ